MKLGSPVTWTKLVWLTRFSLLLCFIPVCIFASYYQYIASNSIENIFPLKKLDCVNNFKKFLLTV